MELKLELHPVMEATKAHAGPSWLRDHLLHEGGREYVGDAEYHTDIAGTVLKKARGDSPAERPELSGEKVKRCDHDRRP